MAPEVIQADRNDYSFKADVYSFGVVRILSVLFVCHIGVHFRLVIVFLLFLDCPLNFGSYFPRCLFVVVRWHVLILCAFACRHACQVMGKWCIAARPTTTRSTGNEPSD